MANAVIASRRRAGLGALLAAIAVAGGASAADLATVGGYGIRWDNTLRYTAALRIGSRSAGLVGDPNSDDGDRNFAPGLISNRLDLVSQLDITGQEFGLHVGAAAWYDSVYFARTDNNSPSTYNAASVPSFQFPRSVRNLHGRNIELLDTFVYANVEAAGMPISLRLGRQTLLWGESLFDAENGIAAAQAPVDAIRDLSSPGTYSNNVFLPVNQVSVDLQPEPGVSFDFYYQLEWRKARQPGAGSYFSYRDYEGAGAERLIVAPGQYLYRGPDITPPSGGQYGLALRATVDDFDLGLYAVRFSAKEPQLLLWPGLDPDPAIGKVGEYRLVYPKAIDLVGTSFSGNLGDSNVAGEISARHHMPLVSISPVAQYDASESHGISEAGYAVGDTLHGQLSSIMTFGECSLWERADLSTEISANYLLAVTYNRTALDPGRDRFAMSVRTEFAPRYFEVLPDLDLTFPLGIGYNAIGRSSVEETQYQGGGDFEAGVSATYLSIWKASLTLTSFFGGHGRQPLADRDFLMMSLERTL